MKAIADNLQSKVEAKRQEMLTPKQRLAIAMHGKLCHHNHTDVCGWFYEIEDNVHNWNQHAHKAYLTKASKVLSSVGEENAELAIDIFKAL